MRYLILSFLILSFIGCGQSRQTDYYYDDFSGENSEVKLWNLSQFPLIVSVPFELAEYGDEIQAAGDKWSQTLGFQAFIFDYGVPNYQYSSVREPLSDDILGIFGQELWRLTNNRGEDLESSVLAVTTLASIDQRIIHADIIFNFDNHSFGDANNPEKGFEFLTVDFESVMIHELGHYLGLKHVAVSEDSASVMKASLNRGESRRELSIQDGERVRRLYINF